MFYQSIADVYDYIFPQSIKQLHFIEKIIPLSKDHLVLDIGCATGNLTDLLSQKCQVIGLDLDEALLKKANEKYSLSFLNKNMLDIEQKPSYDHIISFGNTLVHLSNRKQVQRFFNNVYRAIKNHGNFVVQMINYDRIINQAIDHLPTIDNEHISFVRSYHIHETYVDFETKLTIKSTGQVIENSIPLLALRKGEIEDYLREAGFKNIHFYGDLNGKSLEENDMPLIFSCNK